MVLEILQFYVSGFWVWAGITIGLGMAVQFCIGIFAAHRYLEAVLLQAPLVLV